MGYLRPCLAGESCEGPSVQSGVVGMSMHPYLRGLGGVCTRLSRRQFPRVACSSFLGASVIRLSHRPLQFQVSGLGLGICVTCRTSCALPAGGDGEKWTLDTALRFYVSFGE